MTRESMDETSTRTAARQLTAGAILDRVRRTIGSWQMEDIIIILAGCLLALAIRYSVRGFTSGDYERYTSKWYDFIRANGGFAALRYNFANYTPPYLYLLAIAAAILPGIHKVVVIKLISIPFDFLCAFLVARFVRHRYASPTATGAAFMLILFTPTVFMNGSFWGQIDIIYTTGLVASAYLLSRGEDALGVIAFGVALSFKLQSVFFLPVLLALALARVVRWRTFLLIPLTYFAMMVPAWIAGRPIGELMTIYLTQSGTYESLSLNAPTVYTWLPDYLFETFSRTGIIWAGAALLLFAFVAGRSRLKMSIGLIIELSTISVLATPYLLPMMHERYFFPADVFSILFAIFYPGYLVVPILIQLVSLFSYFPFLFGYHLLPVRTLAMVELIPLMILGYHFVSRLALAARGNGNATTAKDQREIESEDILRPA